MFTNTFDFICIPTPTSHAHTSTGNYTLGLWRHSHRRASCSARADELAPQWVDFFFFSGTTHTLNSRLHPLSSLLVCNVRIYTIGSGGGGEHLALHVRLSYLSVMALFVLRISKSSKKPFRTSSSDCQVGLFPSSVNTDPDQRDLTSVA